MKIIKGDLAVDDRGTVTFVNDFDFKGVKRFYMVENHAKGFVRAWHGHEKEAKYVLVVKGSIILGVVNNNEPMPLPERLILSDKKPQVVYIPPNHYNGFKTLTDDARVMFFSTSTLEESLGDDIRFPADYWDIWEVEAR
jgi:dTDP-4-dehydrorhamnose 3,5-epimerase-like enzyme